ncbi:6,7-dimethyl-8-ribityllumazine synthase [Gephyromycinifex aptenodytis]|uniref:6,7-dimethyl-8-ribityllumazine synthase n=1 Tax=Gephyromycinifex aptenodytis TaxID=2716227 RepID=UPI0014471586|nr:6,7-dimethyl-8-ribityllumazine synthase [Gephyromycinifex aptenodytis]
MSGSGSPELSVDGSGLRVAVVAAHWHEDFMTGLLEGARTALKEAKVEEVEVVRVPGSFELPVVCAALAPNYDAIVALGVIIRGGTPHFEFVAQGVTSGLTRVALDHSTPIGFGVLTCESEAQARDRSGMSGARESKGYEAAVAAITTAVILREAASDS